jgi:hypothetical protein
MSAPDWRYRLARRVYVQFQSSNWCIPLAYAIGNGANELQASALALASLFSIETITEDATSPAYGVGRGVQLDRIGRLVGQPRGASTDDVYRYLLRARIVVNRSTGGPDTAIAVFVAMFNGAGTPLIIPGWIAAFTLRLVGVVLDPLAVGAAVSLLGAATQAGVYSVLEWTTTDAAYTFAFDALGANQGFSNFNDPSTGGLLGGSASAT